MELIPHASTAYDLVGGIKKRDKQRHKNDAMKELVLFIFSLYPTS